MTAADAALPGTPPQGTGPHETSLAVWDIPTPAAGERFRVKIGAKSSAGCALGGCRIEVLDRDAVLASGMLGGEPWPGTSALFWAEVELPARPAPGSVALSARFDAAGLDEPHQNASSPFHVTVVARPDHTLTVKVVCSGVPVQEALVRLGPYRAATDASGQAVVKLAKGRYELHVWKAGYDTEPVPLTVEADAAVQIEARALPPDDPDAVWTA